MAFGVYQKSICTGTEDFKGCGGYKFIKNKSLQLCQYCNNKHLAFLKAQKVKPQGKQWDKVPLSRRGAGGKVQQHGPKKVNELDKWYWDSWKSRPHVCEECGLPLTGTMSHSFISHILSRGAHPCLATHSKNFNIICFDCHQRWEFKDKENMKIFITNKPIIEELYEWERLYYAAPDFGN